MRIIYGVIIAILIATALTIGWALTFLQPIDIFDLASDESKVQAQAAIGQVVGSFAGIVAMVLIAAYGEVARNRERKHERDEREELRRKADAERAFEARKKLRVYQRHMINSLQTLGSQANNLAGKYKRLQNMRLDAGEVHALYYDTILTDPHVVTNSSEFHLLDEVHFVSLVELVGAIDRYKSLHSRLSVSDSADRVHEYDAISGSMILVLDEIERLSFKVANALVVSIERAGENWS